jgi:hypothetical protein
MFQVWLGLEPATYGNIAYITKYQERFSRIYIHNSKFPIQNITGNYDTEQFDL